MEEDKISQLPDDILLLILDKIDIFEAVKTTILSHRWKNLWHHLPRLHFHLSPPFYFLPYIISSLLSHRGDAAPVHDFHLSFHDTYIVDIEFVEECVLYAINHGVQSLRLHAPTYPELRFPAVFFSCKTLRELELRNLRNPVRVPGRLSLPNLKTCHLQTSLDFDDVDAGMEPFSGLPKLEKLTLIKYFWDGLVIKAPKLRVLEIIDCYGVKEICAPLLTSFRYDYAVAWECAKVDLPMLEQVYLDIKRTRYVYNDVLHNKFVRMFHQFQNATTVSLTSNTLKVLDTQCGPFERTTPHPFPNMKCLKVIKRRYGIYRVSKGVINYLMGTLCCELELSPRVLVVEQTCDKEEFNYEKYGCSSSYYDDSE